MQSTEKVAEGILQKFGVEVNEDSISWLRSTIGWHIDDVLKMSKNIRETSLNED